MNEENYYTKLKAIEKGKYDNLSWITAWDILKTAHPGAQRNVFETQLGLNYFSNGMTTYVKVGVIVNDLEHIEYLPIIDSDGISMMGNDVTSVDVNKAIQECTAKAIALHGLDLSLWEVGEELKVEVKPVVKNTEPKNISLLVGDKNWDTVLTYIIANKKLGLTKIVNTLESKYSIDKDTKAEIKKSL